MLFFIKLKLSSRWCLTHKRVTQKYRNSALIKKKNLCWYRNWPILRIFWIGSEKIVSLHPYVIYLLSSEHDTWRSWAPLTRPTTLFPVSRYENRHLKEAVIIKKQIGTKWPTLATRASWMGVFSGSKVLFWPGVPSSAWLPVPVAGFASWFCRPGFWRSVWAEWFRMDATHSSTCKCKKLFQVYLKNKSCKKREEVRREKNYEKQALPPTASS